jgi:chorismate mutase/ribosomal protein S18 acetylase RimI-like enzyme
VGHTEFVLRPAVQQDMAEVAEVYIATRRAAVPSMPASIHTDEQTRTFFAAMPATREIWVAEEDAVVGFLVLDDVWLDSLYVGPSHQGTGVGSMLLDLAKAQRPDGFALWVFEANTPARAFYRRHGLIELEHTDGLANEEKTPDLRMAWPGEQPMSYLRGQIDQVDDDLAQLLARRVALTGAVQGYKERPGHAGRDAAREAQIVARMLPHVGAIDAAGLTRVMHEIISASLDAHS